MKCSIYCFFLILFSISLFCSHSYAQEVSPFMHLSIFGGVAFPVGDFGSTTSTNAGFARTGYSAMLQGDKNITEAIYWTSSISVAVNSINNSALESSLDSSLGLKAGYKVTVNNRGYISTLLMTGLGIETSASNPVQFYGSAQVGVLMSSFPTETISSKAYTANISTNTPFAFAYGFGAGVIYNSINLGVRYFAGEPTYKMVTTVQSYPTSSVMQPHTKILQLMIGYCF